MFVIYLIVTYLLGAIPWSVWLGKGLFGLDPRHQADTNPGAANAFRAGGWRLGVLVLVLDYLKAFIPVLIANYGLSFSDEQCFWIALMSTLGHAFSIFLGFRGGRAIVVMFGVWSGITLYQVPSVMGAAAIVATLIFRSDQQRTLFIPIVVIIFLVIVKAPLWMFILAAVQLLVFTSKIYAPTINARIKIKG